MEETRLYRKEMIDFITSVVESNGHDYANIDGEDELICVYKLFKDGYISELGSDNDLGIVYLYYGYYYKTIKNNYEKCKDYYKLAIDHGNVNSMNNLAMYYKTIEKDYASAKKYYKLAIEHGNVNAMNNLAYYYITIEKDYDEAIKYYKLAIDHGNVNAMHSLAYYYKTIENDYESAIKYYKLAIDHGDVRSMYTIAHYYEIIEKDIAEAIKYYKLAVDNGHKYSFTKLVNHYENVEKDSEKLFKLLIKHKTLTTKEKISEAIMKMSQCDVSQDTLEIFADTDIDEIPGLSSFVRGYHKLLNESVDLINLHFEYAPKGKGAKEAKQDFINRIK